VLVDQGDTVTNGQVLARLEATDYENSVGVSEAVLKQAQAELSLATLNLERSRSLLKSKSISQAQFDTDAASELVAEAKMKNADAELGFARARLGDTQIVSPVSGLVITRDLEVGSTVVPGAAIFRVADTSVLWAVAQVDEREVGQLRVGQPARVVFESNPNAPHPGHVARLSMETDRITEEREVDVTLDRLPSNFFLGQKADVYIETARKENVLQIPVGALSTRDGRPGVFTVTNGRARWQQVQLGLKGRSSVEVISGIDEHHAVILNPFASKQPVADGSRVVAVRAPQNP
jgi:HlyD family secretion protein